MLFDRMLKAIYGVLLHVNHVVVALVYKNKQICSRNEESIVYRYMAYMGYDNMRSVERYMCQMVLT